MLAWLLNRIQTKTHDENRGYATELLSILLQDNPKNRLEFGQRDGAEVLLKTLSVSFRTFPFTARVWNFLQQYRRRDPVDADETEFMDNLFDSLCSALNEPPVKSLFLSAEGPDLMVLMMR